MTERDFPDGRMQKLMGKPWSSWNLPEQPTDLDLRKLRDSFQPPEQFRTQHQSTPLTSKSLLLFGKHPDSDYLSITKCPACGWLLKIQHANKHFLRDSRGAVVCKDSDLAIFGCKVLGKASHPLGELKDTYSKKITLKLSPSYVAPKPIHSLRSMPLMNELVSKSSRSGSHSSKTDYISHSSYRSRSSHSQAHAPPPNPYHSKSRGSSGSSHHSSMSLNSKGKSHSSGKSQSSSSSSWSSLRSNAPNKSNSSHKSSQSSYTLSIPSEDMGQNESVEDLLMSNVSHTYGSSKHTVHIIATSNSKSKAAAAEHDYDHHGHVKFLPEVPEKRIKLDSHSRSSDHYHKSSSMSHGSSADSHDSFSKSKSKYSSTHLNGTMSSHSSSESRNKSKSSMSSSSSSSHAKNDLGIQNKHHLRSTSSSTVLTSSKPVVSLSTISTSSSSQSRSHHLGSLASTTSSSSDKDKDRSKDRSSSSTKKKKRKRDKDEPRKIIPLKDRDFNPDKHCGVCVPGSNVPCKRSLTCKTHSMALRRAVTGRSQSFDALLAAHKLAKTEEKKSQAKEVVEEIEPPKPKKKKPSGSASTVAGSSPNDLGTLAGIAEPTSFGRTKSPDLEVVEVKAKLKPVSPELQMVNHFYASKKIKACPLVYPYTPDIQAKFESVWYNPSTMDRYVQNADEKNKFIFLMKHYKNPYYANFDLIKPVPKSPREKRNVFSIWNASEKPLGGSHHQHTCLATLETKRQVTDSDDGIRYVIKNKK